jgi:hypothetical protein
MTVTIQKACKMQSKLKLAIFGISGSGKTKSALRIASGMGNKIIVIDSEFGSSNLYADEFDFDVINITEPTIDNYIECLEACAGYDVIIIDSLTHCWQGLLKEVADLEKTKYKNSFGAWSEGTPRQKTLINTILRCQSHLIATMRQKTEWTTIRTENGITPSRVGLAPEQGKGIEYEFTLLMQLTMDHVATVIKDRTGKYQDKIIEKPSEEFGKELMEWLNIGASIEEILKSYIEKITKTDSLIALKDVYITSKKQLAVYHNIELLNNLRAAKDERKQFLLKQTHLETTEDVAGEQKNV